MSVWDDTETARDVAAALRGIDGDELCSLNSGSLGELIGEYRSLRRVKTQSAILRALNELEMQHT